MSRGNSLSDELELSSVLGDTRAYLYTIIMREMAPGANVFFYISLLIFLAHPGAISPMGAISRIPVR